LASRADGDHPTALRDAADRLEAGVDAVAIAAVLAQPWADVVLSGAVTEAQLASNVQSLRVPLLRLDASQLAALGAIAEPAHQYWTRRSQLPWL
jgi:aryl-alcohol dehydrogenase-like predicted oxidoreductase